MQVDMHFYGVYAIARAAGINPQIAKIIAHSSQFVDDAIHDGAIALPNQTAMLPIMTSHRPLDYKNTIPGDQWRVWIPFHFLPGNEPESGTFIQRLICRKNSWPAKQMLRNALHPKNGDHWPYLIGIAAHVYADTFSHFGFIGIAHPWNKVVSESIQTSRDHSQSILNYIKTKFEDFKTRFEGDFAEIVPIGHGSVGTYPDLPYLKWEFQYEQGNHNPEDTKRNNALNFLQACKGLHEFFRAYARSSPAIGDDANRRDWDLICPEVKRLLANEAPRQERIRAWKQAISSGVFCDVRKVDREIHYDACPWNWRPQPHGHLHKFFRAAHVHRNYVLHELLPRIGLLV